MIDRRLTPLALLVWAGTALLLGATPRIVTITAMACVLCGLTMLAVRALGMQPTKASRTTASIQSTAGQLLRTIGAALLIAGLLLQPLSLRLAARTESGLPRAAAQRMFVLIEGTVTSEPRLQQSGFLAGALTFDVKLNHAQFHGRHTTFPGTIKVTIPTTQQTGEPPAYGELISLEGKLTPTQTAERPIAQLTASAPPRILKPADQPNRLINSIRSNLTQLISGFSPQARGLVPGAAIGDTSQLSPELTSAMKVSGLTHITAVSGSHFAIVFLIVLAITWKLPRPARAAVVGLSVVGFVCLVHPNAAVLRAAVMGAVAVLGTLRGRPSQALAALASATLGLILYDPWYARDYGFVLSVLATAGLVIGSAPIAQFLHRPTGGQPLLPKTAARAFAVPIAAQLAVGPVLLGLQPNVSLYSVPANLAADPALFPATIFGLLATALSGIWPGAALVFAHIASGATWWIAAVASTTASLPYATIAWPRGFIGVVLLIALTLLVCLGAYACWATSGFLALRKAVATAKTRGNRRKAEDGWREPYLLTLQQRPLIRALHAQKRELKWLSILAAACILLLVILSLRPAWLEPLSRESHFGSNWSMASCDVGQGDAFVAKTAAGNTIMIDTGPPGMGVANCLAALHITVLDAVYISHYHADHVGGLDEVVAAVHVGQIVTGPAIGVDGAARHVQELAAAHNIPLAVLGRNQISRIQPNAEGARTTVGGVKVLWPTEQEITSLAQRNQAGEDVTNASSLVLRIELAGPGVQTGDERGAVDSSTAGLAQDIDIAVALGDLEEDGQAKLAAYLAAQGGTQQVDVVKVAHHGSASLSPQLVAQLHPRVALIGVGKGNSYGHPTQRALDVYSQVGAAILRTDQCGTTAVGEHGGQWFVVGHCP